MLGRPAGETSQAVCKLCGAVTQFPSWIKQSKSPFPPRAEPERSVVPKEEDGSSLSVNSESEAALTRLVMRELAADRCRYFGIGELAKRAHACAPDVARTVRHLQDAGLVVATRKRSMTTVRLSASGTESMTLLQFAGDGVVRPHTEGRE